MSDWLGNLGSQWQKAVRDVKEQLQGPGPNVTLDREPLLVRFDRSRPAADVILDPDAQQTLTPTRNPSSPPDFSEIFVLLAEAEGDDGQILWRLRQSTCHCHGFFHSAHGLAFGTCHASLHRHSLGRYLALLL